MSSLECRIGSNCGCPFPRVECPVEAAKAPPRPPREVPPRPAVRTAPAAPRKKGKARAQHKPGVMNKLETQYSLHLEARRLRGEIDRWDFEPETLRLAKRTGLTPDFRVLLTDGTIEWHECKPRSGKGGPFMHEDAWLKLKFAAEVHPYTFRVAWPNTNRTWQLDEVGA